MKPSDCGILYIGFFRFYQVSRMFNVNPWHIACGAEGPMSRTAYCLCVAFRFSFHAIHIL